MQQIADWLEKLGMSEYWPRPAIPKVIIWTAFVLFSSAAWRANVGKLGRHVRNISGA